MIEPQPRDSSSPSPASTDATLKTQHGVPASDPATERGETGDPTQATTAGSEQLIPGYAVERELGRGGMGVVYRARQLSLGRVVALKMIRQGELASVEDVLRFRREAEALARLEHPNIVRVYEVGEVAGKPFFSMEFVAGGSLDRLLRESRLDPRQSASLVQALAQAMQAAHDAGIIHRDLKPANVLLSGEGRVPSGEKRPESLPGQESAEGLSSLRSPRAIHHSPLFPRITDFGLAKTLGEASQTQSGEIMGTPSYMAPEQAGGKVHLIDVRTDVYALGAILYECLSGQPPFRAASVMDTLQEVLHREPARLSQLRKVPADLETICHKCLQKDPGRRYARAVDLAEDLRRFLAGEPIRARPVTRLERSWRWCKRNPGLASAATVAVTALISGTIVSWLFALQASDNARRADEKARQADQEARRAEDAARTAEANERSARRLAGFASRQRDLTLDSFNTLLQSVQQKLRDTPENRQVKEDLLQTATEGLARLANLRATEVPADPGLAEAHARLGQSLGRLGNSTVARQEYEAALKVLDEVLATRGESRELRLRRAAIATDLAHLLLLVDARAGLSHAEKAVAHLEELLQSTNEDAVRQALASACQAHGSILRRTGNPDLAEKQLRRGLELAEILAGSLPDHPDHKLAVSEARRALAEHLRDTGKLDQAREAFQRVAQEAGTLALLPAVGVPARTVRLRALLALAALSEDRPEADSLYLEGWKLARELAEEEPYTLFFKLADAGACLRLAERQLRAGDRGKAREYAVLALIAGRKMLAADPREKLYLRALHDLHELAGRVSESWGGTLAARNHYRRALEYLLQSAEPLPGEDTRRSLVSLHRRIGEMSQRLGQYSAARQHFTQALEQARSLKEGAVAELDRALQAAQGKEDRIVINSIGMELIAIQPGAYQRGGEQEAREVAQEFREVLALWLPEHPRHEVAITKAFSLGATEVTRAQFRAFVEATGYRTDAERDGKGVGNFNPSGGGQVRSLASWRAEGNLGLGEDHPAIGISWNDAMAFCDWLSRKEGKKYRLPTEAEWEFSCRAGSTTRYASGDDPESLLKIANVPDATFQEAHRTQLPYDCLKGRDGFAGLATVGEFAPNAWGLFDMHGNIWEWCLDGWDARAYEARVKKDPLISKDTPMHPIRGGCFM